jgi:hypothetical protein
MLSLTGEGRIGRSAIQMTCTGVPRPCLYHSV